MKHAHCCFVVATLLPIIVAGKLVGQEGQQFGINISIVQLPTIGITYRLAPTVDVRTSVMFQRQQSGWNGSAFTRNDTSVGIAGDLIFRSERVDHLLPYIGVGGFGALDRFADNAGNVQKGHELGGQVFFGVRAEVVSRVYVYGELAAEFIAVRGDFTRANRFGLKTVPIGLLMYLK